MTAPIPVKRKFRLVAALVIGALAIGGAVATLGLARGWWRLTHPDRTRYGRFGVDVSHHQGEIDWARVVRDPQRLSFAYIKATEGGDYTDPRFRANWEGAQAVGLEVGAYHFFTFCRPAREQAAHFLSVIKDVPGGLIPAVDVEYGGNCKTPPAREAIIASLREWLTIVRAATNRAPIIYATPEAYDDIVREAAGDSPIWLRSIWREPSRPVAMWQFANRAHVEGITGYVDLNAASLLRRTVGE